MDNRAMNAWKHFERTGSVDVYMQYRKFVNNWETGGAGDFPLGGGEESNADYDRWPGHQTAGD